MNNNYILPVNVSHFIHPKTGIEFYTPENDIIFRTIFSDTKNEKITKKFFEHLVEYSIEDISLNANPEYLRTHIVILSKNMPKFKDLPKYHTIWNSREQLFSQYVLDDSVTIHLIELPKYIEYKKISNNINPWIEFIINPLGEEVTEAMRTDKELRLAVDMLNLLNSDEEVRDLAFAEKIAELDKNSALAEAKSEGLSQGIEFVAINLLKNNIPIEDIANMTGLSIERLNALLKESCMASC